MTFNAITGQAEWKKYYHHGTELLEILDTRGLQDTEMPRKYDPNKTPYESIIAAIKEKCPDVVLFLCKATEVHSATEKDVLICRKILDEINKRYHKPRLPVIGVLTKCDELAPPKVDFPTDNKKKNQNLQEQVNSFQVYLKHNLSVYAKDIVPTVTYAEYEDKECGLVLPDEDYRWNLDQLTETIMQYTPDKIKGSFARMSQVKDTQKTIARTLVTSCSGLCAAIGSFPIPGTSVPIVASLQIFMVSYIRWLAGYEFSAPSEETLVTTCGVSGGIAADVGIKLIPGWGSLITATASFGITQSLGDAAILYYFSDSSETETQSQRTNVQESV